MQFKYFFFRFYLRAILFCRAIHHRRHYNRLTLNRPTVNTRVSEIRFSPRGAILHNRIVCRRRIPPRSGVLLITFAFFVAARPCHVFVPFDNILYLEFKTNAECDCDSEWNLFNESNLSRTILKCDKSMYDAMSINRGVNLYKTDSVSLGKAALVTIISISTRCLWAVCSSTRVIRALRATFAVCSCDVKKKKRNKTIITIISVRV